MGYNKYKCNVRGVKKRNRSAVMQYWNCNDLSKMFNVAGYNGDIWIRL